MMMGVCGSGPAEGVENGLACDRSTDVWGVALDRQCRLSVVWPVAPDGKGGSTEGVPGHAPGTYVSTQGAGPTLCASGSPPAAGAFLTAKTGCSDRIAPTATRRRLRFGGRARDTGFARKLRLAKGRYVIWTRAIDAGGNVERKARTRNLRRFTVR
jgi:hypothetical protein